MRDATGGGSPVMGIRLPRHRNTRSGRHRKSPGAVRVDQNEPNADPSAMMATSATTGPTMQAMTMSI